MGCKIIEGVKINEQDQTAAVMYCSTTGMAFGPVFNNAAEIEDFMKWLEVNRTRWMSRTLPGCHLRDIAYEKKTCDPRAYDYDTLMDLYAEWREAYVLLKRIG